MGSSALTNDQLLKIAKQEDDEECDRRHDLAYYEETFRILSGNNKIYTKHIYHHYKKWSEDPVDIKVFHAIINIKRKGKETLLLNKKECLIELDRVLGDYVKAEKAEKKKRLREVSSVKSKAERKNKS
jgi:hypothetical protein